MALTKKAGEMIRAGLAAGAGREETLLLAALPIIYKRVEARMAEGGTDCIVVIFSTRPGEGLVRAVARADAKMLAEEVSAPVEMLKVIDDAPLLPLVRIIQLEGDGNIGWRDAPLRELEDPSREMS